MTLLMGRHVAKSLRLEIKLDFRYRQPGSHVLFVTLAVMARRRPLMIAFIANISRLSSKGWRRCFDSDGAFFAHHRRPPTLDSLLSEHQPRSGHGA
jgi:hypothetical protein